MKDHQAPPVDSSYCELTRRQIEIYELLKAQFSDKYNLASMYLGAIYAFKNTYNPDRLSQAAHSLRELLEKLPRVCAKTDQVQRPNSKEMRKFLYNRICDHKGRYAKGWKGQCIDQYLATTLDKMVEYLELNKATPSRSEQTVALMSSGDPLYDTLDLTVRQGKVKGYCDLRKNLENLAHHNHCGSDDEFSSHLKAVENYIYEQLAPITAQDQIAIGNILDKPELQPSDIDHLFSLINRRGANCKYFFETADDPRWIERLDGKGYFKNPRATEDLDNGYRHAPPWWPILYLKKVAKQAPERVVDIIAGFKNIDNPIILGEILSIAIELDDITLSLRLKSLVMEYLECADQWRLQEDPIINVLNKWGTGQEEDFNAACDIIKYVIAFQPDPDADKKRADYENNATDLSTILLPSPRLDSWQYQRVLEEGIRPVADHNPYPVAGILTKATKWMIYKTHHQASDCDQDYSEIWCRRLGANSDHPDDDECLVQTLVYACGQVYNKAPHQLIKSLDGELREQPWRLFKRIRQHLYASNLSKQTLPWIRDEILGHDDYAEYEHHYEFQLMIRKGCEHFQDKLLSEKEQKEIFEAIRSGPSREHFSESMGEQDNDKVFKKRQDYFHRKQLRPFTALLRGDLKEHFDALERANPADVINDDSYLRISDVTVGTVEHNSPQSLAELENFSDEGLLDYLNDWDKSRLDKDNSLNEVNISGLAGVFKLLFKDRIVPDAERLDFWLANRESITRPIYITTILEAITALIEESNFNNLGRWIEFCAWVLSHPDEVPLEGQPASSEESSDYPDWIHSRRAVLSFINACLDKKTNVPIDARDGLANLLKQLCNQSDWRLDLDCPALTNCEDLVQEGVNNIRSKALYSLVEFGFWIRRQLPEDPVPEVTNILTNRLMKDAVIPLTRPEQAILGRHFENLCILNQDWVIQQREALFPPFNTANGWDVFGSYILFYNRPVKLVFDILQKEFKDSVENLESLLDKGSCGGMIIERLGVYLFSAYYWESYPLQGDNSLLERFYYKTKRNPIYWRSLFDKVGRSLRNRRELDKSETNRIKGFFTWRLKTGNLLELEAFTYWLEAECLDPVWRLQSYSKVLDLIQGNDFEFSSQLDSLNQLLSNHLELVVECFAKMTDSLFHRKQTRAGDYLAKNATDILNKGLNCQNSKVKNNAKRAQDNLLKLGYSNNL